MPLPNPISSVIASAYADSASVTGRRSIVAYATGWPSSSERPRLPCSSPTYQRQSCVSSG
jgi:hypothetical protein